MILVNLNNTENSVGTGQELQYAVDKGIPVIGFGKQNVYEWLPEDCDVVFDTLEEAVDCLPLHSGHLLFFLSFHSNTEAQRVHWHNVVRVSISFLLFKDASANA